MQEYFEIGQIVNTFGIKGMVKVVPYTDDITRFDNLKKVYVEIKNNKKNYEIEEVKYHKNMVLLKIKGINDMNQAEKCKGLYLKIHRKDAIKLPKDTYFIADLLGLEVYTDEGVLLGKVDALVFTAGIGENSPETRLAVVEALAPLGIKIDALKNNVRGKFTQVNADDSTCEIYVLPTNEELMIAKDTLDI